MQTITNNKYIDLAMGIIFALIMLFLIFLSNIIGKENGGFIDDGLPMIAIYAWIIVTVASFFTSRKLFGLGSILVALGFAGIALYGLSGALL